MNRTARSIIAAITLFAGTALSVNPAHATTVTHFDYTITSESPTLSITPSGHSCSDEQSWYPTNKQYEIIEFEVSETGYYTFTEERTVPIDGMIIFLQPLLMKLTFLVVSL